VIPQSASPDGRFLVFAAVSATADLLVLPLEGDREPRPFATSEFDDSGAEYSPDGRWIAYHCDDSDEHQVYVQPFPGPGGKWRVSIGGGMNPRWRSDGRELLFATGDGKVMAAAVDGSGDRFEVGAVRELFELRRLPPHDLEFDVSSDGQRFLVRSLADTAQEPVRLIFNWKAQLAGP
jgi:Tol biopolymer transport system component